MTKQNVSIKSLNCLGITEKKIQPYRTEIRGKGNVVMFKNYVLSMLNGKPYQPMLSPDGGAGDQGGGDNGGGDGGSGDDDKDGDDKGDDKDGDGSGDDSGDGDKVTFDEKQQEEIDKIINRTIAKERKKAESDRKKAEKDAEERAKMTAEEKAEAERKEREEAAQKRMEAANQRIVNAEIREAARDAGVSPKKLDRFLKVVDRDDIEIDDDGNVDGAAIKRAVKSVLDDMPEFKGTQTGKGPGDFGGGSGESAKYTMEQIRNMSPKEIAADYEEVQKALTFHQKK